MPLLWTFRFSLQDRCEILSTILNFPKREIQKSYSERFGKHLSRKHLLSDWEISPAFGVGGGFIVSTNHEIRIIITVTTNDYSNSKMSIATSNHPCFQPRLVYNSRDNFIIITLINQKRMKISDWGDIQLDFVDFLTLQFVKTFQTSQMLTLKNWRFFLALFKIQTY